MFTTIRYVLLAALRDRIFPVLIAGMIFSGLIAGSLAGTSLVEEQAMTLSFSAGVARLVLAIGMVVFVAFHMRYAFDNKEVDVMLSRPISRPQLVLGYWMSFACIATLLAAAAVGLMAFLEPQNMVGFMHWGISLMLELWLIASLVLFTSLMLSSAVVSVMVSLGIYVLARMMGYFLATIKSGLLFRDANLSEAARQTIDKIAAFVPRLDFFAPSEWLIYGIPTDGNVVSLYMLQAVIFIPLLLLAATVDFKKREF